MNHHHQNNNKVHSSSRVGNIPFSWENQPGVTKPDQPLAAAAAKLKVLPPPPCHQHHNSNQAVPHLRTSSSRKGSKEHQDHDPFLAAYEACTKSGRKKQQQQHQQALGEKKRSEGKNSSMGSLFSCRKSCAVKEDRLVKLSHVSPSLRRDKLRFDGD